MLVSLYEKEIDVRDDLIKRLENSGNLKVDKNVIDIYLKMDGIDGTELNKDDLSRVVNESLEREIEMQDSYKDEELMAALAMHGIRKIRKTKNHQ